MKDINGLMKSLNGYLNWNKARIDCFVRMLVGMIGVSTVNLKQIALAYPSDTKVTSRYRRLQRFFAFLKIDLIQISRWIFKLYFPNDQKFYIIIDRTNWYWGKKKINVFMLSIAYEGLAIPILWQMLDKGGSSNFNERKALINQFINIFGPKRIIGILGDREFASGRFFGWLNKRCLPFYIRIKEGSVVTIKGKKLWPVKKLFNDLSPKTSKFFPMAVNIFGQSVFVSGSRSERGELMIVATNRCPKNAIPIYLRRWEIESLFQSLKGRGFRFEETHMTDLERIEKLIGALAVAFVWAHKVGEWCAVKRPIIFKKFRESQRPQNTFFRYGLDYMRNLFFQGKRHTKLWLECIKIIQIPLSKESIA